MSENFENEKSWSNFSKIFEIFSRDFRNLFTRMTSRVPEVRPGLDEIREHPWFNGPTANHEEVLKEMEEVAKPYRCAIKAELLQSRKAGLAVVQEAVGKRVDAVVLGATYRHEFGSFSMGDTVPYVLKNAPCKVLLWRDAVPHSQAINGRS